MQDRYRFRRAESDRDAVKLRDLFTAVFYPEQVGVLAETMFHHLPGLQKKYWFIAEEKKSSHIVAAFALIPWTWQMGNVHLKVAEMGIVGTLPEHRGQGLMRVLNQEFDQTLAAEQFDLAVIQGIPGFYDQFGYQFAVPLENHINLPLHLIPNKPIDKSFSFRLASLDDIPFFMTADAAYRSAFDLAVARSAAHWHYLLTDSPKTEFGSEFWIIENQKTNKKHYFRIPADGFGDGLIVSEVSENLDFDTFITIMTFCKQKAVALGKPYIRLNLHNDSTAGRMAISIGASKGEPYAWQIKIPDMAQTLTSIAPVLEKRIKESSFNNFSAVFRLDFFKRQLDLVWKQGKLINVQKAAGECALTFTTNLNNLPALCLGHRSWRELRYIKPDIFPNNGQSALFFETLFPPCKSWIHEQY